MFCGIGSGLIQMEACHLLHQPLVGAFKPCSISIPKWVSSLLVSTFGKHQICFPDLQYNSQAACFPLLQRPGSTRDSA